MKSTDKYEYLEHTADIKFRAYGDTIEEAFANAVLASVNVITEVEKINKKIKKEITLTARTKESLLYDLLEEVVFLIDTESFLIGEVNGLVIREEETETVQESANKNKINQKNFKLKATFFGDKCSNYSTKGDIKSPTYNSMFIKKEKDRIIVQVVLDI